MEVVASELMIGNLLYFKGTDMVAKVQLINAPKHFDCRDEFGSFVPNGEYEPIPITEEWLIKLGFSNDCPSYVIDNDNFTFKMLFHDCWNIMYNEKPGYGSSECVIQGYPYIHELQNLYRALTQQPLTIKK